MLDRRCQPYLALLCLFVVPLAAASAQAGLAQDGSAHDGLAQDGPLTVAERTGFEATSRHADVVDFLRELQSKSSKIRLETLATSTEGRAVPLVVLGDPVPSSPADLKRDDRAVVYFQADIHAGEVEGKEAAQMLVRDVLYGRTAPYLEQLVILIAPIFNPDGNEKISTANRPNQQGPEQGVGSRYNGQNLDLNRDGLKLESPEVRGLVDVLNRWDPVFFLDSHTHNGSYHQEPVTWTWGLNPNGAASILAFMETELLPAVTERMRDRYATQTIPHGDFQDPREPAKGWMPLGPQPRYLSNYVGLRNRLSVLNEQYPYADFETRVRGCYNLFRTFLDYLSAHKAEVVAMVRQADRRTIERGAADGEVFVVEYAHEPIERRLTIQGYEMEPVEVRGRTRYRPTEQKRTYTEVPYLARITAQRTVRRPRGYLIAVPDADVPRKLRQHGISVERLTAPAKLTVEQFLVTGVEGASRPDQGHYTTRVSGEYATVEREFAVGTFYVDLRQALGNVAAYLLEPESDDGLVMWNAFDRYLTAQWSREPQIYPVFKLLEPVNLVKETLR